MDTQALRNMLEQELWKRLPMIPGSLPDLAKSMEAPGSEASATGSFEHWAERGNPWSASSHTLKKVWAFKMICFRVVQLERLSHEGNG